jgi:hypothetical protein
MEYINMAFSPLYQQAIMATTQPDPNAATTNIGEGSVTRDVPAIAEPPMDAGYEPPTAMTYNRQKEEPGTIQDLELRGGRNDRQSYYIDDCDGCCCGGDAHLEREHGPR